MRTALGASRGRIVRQFLVEVLALSIAGGVGRRRSLPSGASTRWSQPPRSRFRACTRSASIVAVLAFTTLVSMATGILFGVRRRCSCRAPIPAKR